MIRRKAKAKAVRTLQPAEKETRPEHLVRCPRNQNEVQVPVDVRMHQLAINGAKKANATKAAVVPIGTARFAPFENGINANAAIRVHLPIARSCTARLRHQLSLKPMSFRQPEYLTVLRMVLRRMAIMLKMSLRLLRGRERRRIRLVCVRQLGQLAHS